MKTLGTIQKLYKIGKILSRIAFIISVIGFCGCIAALLSLGIGNGSLIKIGGVTLQGLISDDLGYNIRSIGAALSGWLFVCAGEAVVAKFAEIYFKNELKAGTPFTLGGAGELLRLGIITVTVPVGCEIAGSIAMGIIAGFMRIAEADMHSDSSASIALGVMFIIISLLCRYGAELRENVRPE